MKHRGHRNWQWILSAVSMRKFRIMSNVRWPVTAHPAGAGVRGLFIAACSFLFFLFCHKFAFLRALEYSKFHENWHNHQNWHKLQSSAVHKAWPWSAPSIAPPNLPHRGDQGAVIVMKFDGITALIIKNMFQCFFLLDCAWQEYLKKKKKKLQAFKMLKN